MPSSYLTEVAEQSSALKRMVEYYRQDGRRLLAQWRQMAEAVGRLLFIGMGTSEYVVESILPLLGRRNIEAATMDAGEWWHYPRPYSGLPVLISQSGESAETREAALTLNGRQPFVALTNYPGSTIAHQASLHLPMLAGAETAISTKTYVNSLGLLYLLAQPEEKEMSALEELDCAANRMNTCDPAAVNNAANLLRKAHALHFIGRGPAMAAAKQAALTFMEGARLYATALTGGAFRHGPRELMDETHHCVVFIPQGPTEELLLNTVAEVLQKGSRVVAITNRIIPVQNARLCLLPVPQSNEALFPLLAATAQELLLEALARQRGLAAGEFRHSQKITSTE